MLKQKKTQHITDFSFVSPAAEVITASISHLNIIKQMQHLHVFPTLFLFFQRAGESLYP